MDPPWEVGKKVYINGTCHLTKIAAMLIYGKNIQKSNRPRYQVSVYRTIGPLVLLAHLSRRLIGELIVYPWSGVHPFTFSKIFSSETAWLIKVKFNVEPPFGSGNESLFT